MHRPIALAMVFLLTAMPGVAAQDAAPTFVLLSDDAEDDHDFSVENVEQDEESPLDPADLLSLEMAEDDAGFWFRLGVSGLEHQDSVYNANGGTSEAGAGADYSYYYYLVTFQALENTYYLYISYDVESDRANEAEAAVYVEGADGYFDYIEDVAVTIDEEAYTFTLTLPHDFIQDANGRQARPGDRLTNFYVRSEGRSSAAVVGYMESTDRLPDTDYITTPWEVQTGTTSAGHIDAWSDFPVRVSNGEATTFLYEVEVQNLAEYVDTVLPEWSGGADNWVVTFPDGKVRLEPDEAKTIPFLVTVPFAHKHGTYHPFNVTFQSQADPLSIGRVELGVRYTFIPQPAGHHPSIYLHAEGYSGFFNTVQGDDYPDGVDQDELDDGYYGSCGYNDREGRLYPLSPSLQMGVDFDLESLGEATFRATSDVDASGVTFQGYVIVSDDRPSPCDALFEIPDGTVATIDQTDPIDIAAETVQEASSTIRPTEHGDYIPFEEGNQMYIAVAIGYSPPPSNDVFCCPVPEPDIELVTDTELFLPLIDYHDDVDEFFDRLSGIDLYATTSQERYVNPGEVVVFRATAQNIGIETSSLELEMTGSNLEWAQLVGDDRIKIKPGESQDLAVAIVVPEGSADGELVDVTLHATNEDDESVRSLIRFLAEVDTDADHDDEASSVGALDQELKQSPAPFVPALLVLVAIGAIARRR